MNNVQQTSNENYIKFMSLFSWDSHLKSD